MDDGEESPAAAAGSGGDRAAPTAPQPQATGAGAAAPPAQTGPEPFKTGRTVVATVFLTAVTAFGVAIKWKGGLQTHQTDPLEAFDSVAAREGTDPPLSREAADDAQRTLEALIHDARQPVTVETGAHARLAVVLGEGGRWDDARANLESADRLDFTRAVTCAYGPADMICATLPACDDANVAALNALAGPWAATRACCAAARRRGDTAAEARWKARPASSDQVVGSRRKIGILELTVVLVLLAMAAGAALAVARRRCGWPRPTPLPAPWRLRQLYAALIRCGVWSLLFSFIAAIFLALVRVPPEPTVGILMYVAAGFWMQKLVFQRFGLSWTDSLGGTHTGGGPRAGAVALFALVAVGIDRAGEFTIRYAAAVLHQRTPWSDYVPPQTARLSAHLVGVWLQLVVLAPLVEELVFRRAIFAAIRKRRRFAWAALASAAIFALPHSYGIVGTLTVFWTGLVTAWAFDRTANLWPSLLVHVAHNALAALGSLT